MSVPLALIATDVVAVAADVLVGVSLLVITLGVLGTFRMPDVYTQLHTSAKAVFLGVITLLVASLATADPAVAARAVLIAVFLLLTTPVAAHAIAQAARGRGEKMKTPGAVDHSGSGLDAD